MNLYVRTVLRALCATGAVLGLLTVAPSARAADVKPTKPEMKLNVPEYNLNTQVFDFPTGLRIMMQSDRSHPVVSTYMVIDHGTKDDPPGKEETAHFCEHTWFRSKHGTLPPIMDLVQDIGSRFNATTANDNTDFRTVASSEYLPLLLRLESLRLTEPHAGVTEAEIDIEREVIRSEWRRRNEQGWISQVFNFVYESVYPADHPYHDHSTHESIDNIKLADLQKFMDDYYKPENTTILVIGDFDPAEAASLIFSNFAPSVLHPRLKQENYYYAPKPGITHPDQNNPNDYYKLAWDPDSDPKNPQPFQFAPRTVPRITDERPPVPPVGTTEVMTKKAPVPHKTVTLGWSLPGGYRSDQEDFELLANMANNYMYSGLYLDYLRDPKGPLTNRIGDFGCFVQQEVVNTTFICIAELLDPKLDPLVIRDKMLDQLPQIWNNENFAKDTPNSQYYLNTVMRGKMERMTDLLLSLDVFAQEFGGRSELIGDHAHYTNSAMASSELMGDIMKSDPAKVSQMGYEFLKRERAATVILEPLSQDEIDVGSEKSTYAGSSKNDQVFKSNDNLKEMTAAEIAHSYIEPNLADIQDFDLPNNMRVVILKHGTAPLVEATVIFGRDYTAEPMLLRNFANQFIRSEGADPLPIAGEVSYYRDRGVQVDPSAGGTPPFALPFEDADPNTTDSWGNATRMSIRAPSGNLDGALWILQEELETAKPYVDDKIGWLENEKQNLEDGWADRDTAINQATSEFLFPDAPWDHGATWEDYEKAKAWTAADVDGVLAQIMQPKNATLLIVGNVDPEAAKAMAVTYFGGWAASPSATPPPKKTVTKPAMPTAPSKILIYDDPKRTQTDLNLQCRLNVTSQTQEDAVQVLSSLLGTEVFSTMRVQDGLAYSPGANAQISSDGSSVLAFYSDGVVNSGVGKMMTFFTQALTNVEEGTIDTEELTEHKLRTARAVGVSAQSLDQITDKVTRVVRNQETWETLEKRGDLIAAVDAAELQKLLQGCREHNITTMVGPKEQITPQLDELGLKYEVVPWSAQGSDLLWKYDPKQAKKNEKKKQKDDKKKAKEDAKKKDEDSTTGS